MTTTKEHPIIFTGHSVPAILDRRKTMTRRAIKPQPVLKPDGTEHWWRSTSTQSMVEVESFLCGDDKTVAGCFCPYGAAGDRLWVKETWSPDHAAFYPHFPRVYKADETMLPGDIENGEVFSGEVDRWFPFKWRSPLFMPRSASRILLEITEVRVERLQAISEEDCWAEGIDAVDGLFSNAELIDAANRMGCCIEDARPTFACLWDQLNAKRGFPWSLNPFVWVIAFRRLEPQ